MAHPPHPLEIPAQLNLFDHFLEARLAEGLEENVALRTATTSLTYRQVHAMAGGYATVLADRGVRREDRVMLALPDTPDFVATFFAVLKLGGVVVMVNPQLKPANLSALFDHTGVQHAVVQPEVRATFEEAVRTASTPPALIWCDDELRNAVASSPDGAPTASTHRDDPALWLFSGGTTGLPKAVVQSHASFVNTTHWYAKQTLQYGPEDITLSVPKLFFGYATGSNLLFPFAVGASAVLFEEHPTPEVLFQQIAQHRPSILINVPTMIRQMVTHPDAAEQDLSSLRLATSAGEALPTPLYERWKEVFGVELLDGLGTAEMWHIFVTNRLGAVKPGTLGQVVEGFEIRVRDDEGTDLPSGEVGRLWVRGNSRAWGYWRNLPRTQEAFRGPWFVGGDLVSRDEEGYVTYCGRGDDVLKVGGRWLAPREVESCLMEHPAVVECAVVGVENQDGLTKPVAFVLARGATDDLEATLQQHCLDRLEPYKHPRRILEVTEFSRTHLGKIDRAELKRIAQETAFRE